MDDDKLLEAIRGIIHPPRNGWRTIIIAAGLGLLLQAAAIVWWASSIESRVDYLVPAVEKNSSFVELWPVGKWGAGSLPSDLSQDLKIAALESDVQKIRDRMNR